MPFISKDWRSPGEEWVKTQEGWEKKKVLECTAQLDRCAAISNFNNASTHHIQNSWDTSDLTENEKLTNENGPVRIPPPPHCHITIKCTREIAGFNGLSEAVRRLDFMSAVRDVRRFNYICALLNLLVTGQKLTGLPGAAQKVLLTMLEEVAVQVSNSQQNLKALRDLIVALGNLCEDERRSCWGRPLGSKALWGHHSDTISRIHDIAQRIDIREPGPEVVPKLQQLPEECIREVLLRISDHKDLEASSAAWSVMASLCSEQRIWRELVHFHFSPSQIDFARNKLNILSSDKCDWKALFHSLRKTFGLREDVQYAETLSLCRHCKCLFWRSLGHPCIADQCPEYRERLKEAGGPLPPHPIPPADFLKFFSL